MADGIVVGIGLIILGVALVAIGGMFFAQATTSNQTMGQAPTTQIINGAGIAFVGGGALSIILGIIGIFTPSRKGSRHRHR